MTSQQIQTTKALQQVVPGPWMPFEQLSICGYRLPLGTGTDLIVHALRDKWTASFGEAEAEIEIELSSPASTPAEAVAELIERSRRLTMLTCRTSDRPANVDDFMDHMRSSLYGVLDVMLSEATLERANGSWPKGSRSLRAAGS